MEYIPDTRRTYRKSDKQNSKKADAYAARMRAAMSDHSYAIPESSLRLPFDNTLFGKTKTLAKKISREKLVYVVVAGIGGSSLGAKAVYDALAGTLDGYMPFAPKILFADTCSPELLRDVAEILLNEMHGKEEFVIVVVSKSGTTAETVVSASILVTALEGKFGNISDRVVCVTNEGSPLWVAGEKNDFHLLSIPRVVPGRYSVFSPAGIFPLLCAGVDADAFLRGAQSAVHECVEGGSSSRAFFFANDMFSWIKQGACVFDTFLFHPELESLGKWVRQLVAESLGKDATTTGEKFPHLIVPVFSIGSTDLHSLEQMNLSHQHFFGRIFVRARGARRTNATTAKHPAFSSVLPETKNKAASEVLEAIYDGAKNASKERNLSFCEIRPPGITAEFVGELMQFEMCSVMHLANMLNIDAFNQPFVDDYKKQTLRILGAGVL